MATQKTVKEVTFIARVQFKSDHRKVVYLTRSSNGVDQYETTLFDGNATGCSCPSRKPCKHMKAAEQKEAARPFAAKSLPKWTVNLVNAGVIEIPGKVKTEAPKLTNPFKRPSKWVAERLEADQNYREVKSQMRELKEHRELAPLNGNRAFSIMR